MADALWITWSFDHSTYFGQILNVPESAFTIGDATQVRAFANSMTAGEDAFVAFCGSLNGVPVQAVLEAPEVFFGDLVIWEAAGAGEVIADALAAVGDAILEALV